VPELIAKPALPARPLTLGACTLTLLDPGPIASIAVFPGQEKATNKALKPLGLTFPAPNRFVEKAGARLVWTARHQAFLIGIAAPDLAALAAVTDQSGGWAMLGFTGANAPMVLARLIPLDLRLAAFAVGSVARTALNHMQAVILRPSEAEIQLMVFRSMARSAWHEIEAAMKTVAARAA
jgi:heterotetrameric sarcosine oxidase gamma subunit